MPACQPGAQAEAALRQWQWGGTGALPGVRTHVGTRPWSLDSGVARPAHQRKHATKFPQLTEVADQM